VTQATAACTAPPVQIFIEPNDHAIGEELRIIFHDIRCERAPRLGPAFHRRI